jgi:putative oxidoreductase
MENQPKTNKTMNVILWVAQGILGIMFLMTGIMKITQPIEKLVAMMSWVNHASPVLIRFIGLSELLGGLGILLPSILRIKPNLTVWAAIGLILVMISAVFFHISIGEANMIGTPIILGLITVFVAWGRTKKAIILPR